MWEQALISPLMVTVSFSLLLREMLRLENCEISSDIASVTSATNQ